MPGTPFSERDQARQPTPWKSWGRSRGLNSKEGRNPNSENGLIRLAAAPPGWLSIRTSVFGVRISALGLLSAFDLRISDFRLRRVEARSSEPDTLQTRPEQVPMPPGFDPPLPGGMTGNSPTFPRWGCVLRGAQVPKGRLKSCAFVSRPFGTYRAQGSLEGPQ